MIALNEVLKDQDLVFMLASFEKSLLKFRLTDILAIVSMIKSDAKFLNDLKLMDYSLLLAVEEVSDQ